MSGEDTAQVWDRGKEQAQCYTLVQEEKSWNPAPFIRTAICLRDTNLPKPAFKTGSLHVLAIQGSVTEDGRAQQGVFTWIWTCWSDQPPPDLGKQQPWSLCSTALMPGQGEGQEEQLHEGILPPKWGGKKAFPFPPGTGSCAQKARPLQGRQRTQPHVSESGSSASRQMQLEGWSNPTTFPLKRF